jgi:hypothetical protein
MSQFHRFITEAALKEVHLEGMIYTWSNERSHPTLEKIDRCFISTEWDLPFPGHELTSMPSIYSDHVPLLLCLDSSFAAKKRFMFLSFWHSFPNFRAVLERVWRCLLCNAIPFHRLDWLFQNSARMLKSWSDRTIGNIMLQLKVTKEVLLRLDQARDLKPLASHEEALRQLVKWKSVALASLQRSTARQKSRVMWLREGDASTKFFRAHAISRRCKNYDRSLLENGEVLVSEEHKAEAVHRYFDGVLRRTSQMLLIWSYSTYRASTQSD